MNILYELEDSIVQKAKLMIPLLVLFGDDIVIELFRISTPLLHLSIPNNVTIWITIFQITSFGCILVKKCLSL